ncbi:MAG: Rne/Rng family ribonuclease [Proteobacteria bacterium]|nr:Rne/Rng family ribonuclease [Pseudomonadota bacterium]NCA28216.1 Rne/Rng family ribonuclease [Pseudomonadota bacterium]
MTKITIAIDGAHREETRVAVLGSDGKLLDFDRSALAIKQIKGNIYLSRVTRVEPSLQACFVDYGSDRHGFLPFADIHPDYYQISEVERQKLRELNINQNNRGEEDDNHNINGQSYSNNHQNYNSKNHEEENTDGESITTGSYSVEDEVSEYGGNIYNIHKRFNIQEVIKPNQLILVQVSKEERGNKGASMTTYISIAGKYCVLMANTPNKGGVSKKVDNFRDRKILRSILSEINIGNDRSVIIRTAGVGKKPEEIKRDCEYLNRLWDNIREISQNSKAPSFIHAEDDIIRRCIRDIYNENVNEVIVEGQDSFEIVTNFVKLTMPSAPNNIKLHDDRVPIFNKYRIEQQISALYEKQISLPSGGSIVIDHTEALVAIDVNSGRATKESGVEETAFNTNLEAVREIARQLRLRDLAGLIVIDFIDMYEQKHRRNIERALRDELQNDRARIQLGRISVFGLLEMSRQRLGASFFETITEPCKHCGGTGYVRSVEILAVSILRAIRHACADKQTGVIYVYASPETLAYIMNFKKNEIVSTEKNYSVHIFLHPSEENGSQGFNIKKRKSLSEDEKREFDMQTTTGKVNQLGIEKSYFEEINNQDESSESDDFGKKNVGDYDRNKSHHQKHRNDKKFNKRHDSRNRNNNQDSIKKKSFFSFLFNK